MAACATLTRTAGHQRGVALVELALVLSILLLLLLGTAEYGRAFYTYNALAKSVRSAARYLAVADDPTDATTQAQARNLTLYGDVDAQGNDMLVAPGLTSKKVQVQVENGVDTGSGLRRLVTVRISGYVYPSMLSVVTPATMSFADIGATLRARP